MTPRYVWAALIGVPTAFELAMVVTGRTEWTASPQLRWALRCNTKAGQATTTLLVGAGSSWLAHHLLTVEPSE